jgi:7-cyano-7-deazaguanine synthase
MLLQAATLAWNKHASIVAYAAHHGDYAQYPDCREVFVDAFNNMLATAMVGQEIKVEAPFMYFSKAQIVRLGSNLHVPFELTWSCYEGNELQCGLCGTCYERRVAMREAGVIDPSLYRYEMPDYEGPNR